MPHFYLLFSHKEARHNNNLKQLCVSLTAQLQRYVSVVPSHTSNKYHSNKPEWHSSAECRRTDYSMARPSSQLHSTALSFLLASNNKKTSACSWTTHHSGSAKVIRSVVTSCQDHHPPQCFHYVWPVFASIIAMLFLSNVNFLMVDRDLSTALARGGWRQGKTRPPREVMLLIKDFGLDTNTKTIKAYDQRPSSRWTSKWQNNKT